MKRTACVVCIILMLVILSYGCTTDGTVNNNYQTIPTSGQQIINPTTKKPEVVNLSVNNIEEYVAFSIDISDTEKWGIADTWRCTGKLTVKTVSKQKVEFKNLTVTFKLVPQASYQGYGWDKVCCDGSNEEFSATLDIPYSGTWEESFRIQSEAQRYVGTDPKLKLVVIGVSGQVIVD